MKVCITTPLWPTVKSPIKDKPPKKEQAESTRVYSYSIENHL